MADHEKMISRLSPEERVKLGAKLIGSMSSPRKAAAARKNGKKGGRPRLKNKSPGSTTCTVKVSNGTIVLPPGFNLPDGAKVQLSVPDSVVKQSFMGHFAEFIGAADDLPSDMAANIDHYAHGHPKK